MTMDDQRSRALARARQLAVRALSPTGAVDHEAATAHRQLCRLAAKHEIKLDEIVAGMAASGPRAASMSLDDWLRIGDKAKELLAAWREAVADPRVAPTVSLVRDVAVSLIGAIRRKA
jgi:hypothetical protein